MHLDGAPAGDQIREFVDRQIGALPRAVHRKEPQADDLERIEVREGVRQQLARPLAGRVRRDRQDGGLVFGKRRGRCIPVHRRRRAEHDACEPGAADRIDQTGSRRDIRVHVGAGVLERGTDARFCRQMDDSLDAIERHGIAGDVGLDESKPGKRSQAGEIALFDVTRVERVEVVDPGHFVPTPYERLAQVRSDESGGAGDQKPVRHVLRAPSCATIA